MSEVFRRFAHRVSKIVGSSWAFLIALIIVVVWAITGPIFHFSDTWQLVINTGTTIITFLMVFLIQNTQNRDSRAVQLKLDELIAAKQHARNRLIDLEDCSDEELDQLEQEFQRIRSAQKARRSHEPEPSRADNGKIDGRNLPVAAASDQQTPLSTRC